MGRNGAKQREWKGKEWGKAEKNVGEKGNGRKRGRTKGAETAKKKIVGEPAKLDRDRAKLGKKG